MKTDNSSEKGVELKYDDEQSFLILKRLFVKANRSFLRTDKNLIKDDVAERTMCGSLKSHLEKELIKQNIKGYYVDVEYNRNNGKVKTILDDNYEIVKIQCDLIIHSRGENINQDNLLEIEMKKSYRSEESKNSDRIRLRALTKSTYDNDIWAYDGISFPKHVCRYIMGIFYEIDKDKGIVKLEFYKNGEMISKNKIYLNSPFYAPIKLKNRTKDDIENDHRPV